MHAQTALLITKSALVNKFNFLARTIEPALFARFAKDVDNAITQFALQKLSIENDVKPDSLAMEQLVLPFRFGGRGLTLLSALSPFCYMSSLASAISDFATFSNAEPPASAFPTLYARFTAAHGIVAPFHQAPPNPNKPPTLRVPPLASRAWQDFANHSPPPKLQSLLLTPFYENRQYGGR